MSPIPPSKSGLVLRIASALAIVGLAMCAAAASPAAADPQLEILTGTEAQSVQLQVCPKGPSGSGPAHACFEGRQRPYLGGRLTILVREGSGGVTTPKFRFVPKGGTKPISLPGGSDRVFVVGEVEDPLKLRNGIPLSLTIGFALPLTESAAAIDGKLLISLKGEKPQIVPVSGETPSFSGVTVVPTTLPMDTDNRTAKVTLEGPELGEYLRSHGGDEPEVVLYGDGSDTGGATLTLPSFEKVKAQDDPSRATATVTLADTDPAAGKYTGKLTLPGLSTETGSLTIELSAHDCWLLLLALVFAGIVTTGVGTRLVTTATRRSLLTDVLKQTHGAYIHIRDMGKDATDTTKHVAETTESWHLEDLLAEDTSVETDDSRPKRRPLERWSEWRRSRKELKVSRLQGLPALRESIETARSSKDLDEDAARVLDMVARMQRWLRVEPAARRLAAVAQTRRGKATLPTADGSGLEWDGSNTVRDTGILREMAQREPEDAKKADDLVARLLFQAKWHNTVAAMWDATLGKEEPIAAVLELEKALEDTSKVESRSVEDQDNLEAKLERFRRTHFKSVDLAGLPEIREDEHFTCGITPVRWDASANLFTGWATLDEASYGQLERRAATSSRRVYMPSPTDLKHEIGLVNMYDWAWTAAILLFASAAYGATTYSNTWGSCADLATAFLAGSLGKVTIDWAALPIFQSIRLRKAEAG